MKIYSKTHTITDKAGIAVKAPLNAHGKPLSKTAVINHPAGTVLEMDDDAANDLIDRGVATEYKAEDHEGQPDGFVNVERAQMQTQLAEGQTQPAVVRQDETLNDGPKGAKVGPTVYFDTKDADALQKEREDELAKSRVANPAGNAVPAGGDANAG